MSPRAIRRVRATGTFLGTLLAAATSHAQLAPPPPLGASPSSSAAASSTPAAQPAAAPRPVEELDRAKKNDSGRGLSWFWLEAEGGYEHIDLTTFDGGAAFTGGVISESADGGAVSAGIGAQLVFLTLGARARFGFFDQYRLSRIGGELGLRLPLGRLEPRFDLGAGYAALGTFDGVAPNDFAVGGAYARAGAGLDFFPVELMSIGAHATFDVLALTRAESSNALALATEESSVGSTFAIQLAAGLHF
jgi:hypothetical protein